MPEQALRTGIVAIGRNEGERLKRCLASLPLARAPVVYVDSGSTDGSQEAARTLGAEVHALDMARPFTAARARSEGFASLTAQAPELDYVMFIDGDCELEAGWLERAVAWLDGEPAFAVACGRRRERFLEASPYNRMIDAEWNTPVGEAGACGGDAVFRVRAYREAGGFDPAIIAGEEPELCTRLRAKGWRIVRLDAPMTIHDADMHRFGQWWRRAVRSGMGYAQAWWATRGRGDLYRSELLRAVAWAGVLPAAAVLIGLAVHPALVLTWPAAALAQTVRLARRSGWRPAWLLTLGKYAELIGIATQAGRAIRGTRGGTVFYK